MKIKFFFLLAFCVLAAVASCEKEYVFDGERIVLTRAESDFLETGQSFPFNLFGEVAKENEYANVVFSPLSVQFANSMLSNGASGETYRQIINTLGYDDCSANDLNSVYRKIVGGLDGVDASAKVSIANSVWINDGFTIQDDFKKAVVNCYDSKVANLDFTSSKAVKSINDWGAKKTNGQITDIMRSIPPYSQIIIANALYFKGKWKDKFSRSNTGRGSFKALDGSLVAKDFMNAFFKMLYSESEDGTVRMCEIPYGNGAFVLDVVLPDENMDFAAFVSDLSEDRWDNMFSYTATHEVRITLPKFKIESEYDLKRPLQALGMTLPYDRDNVDLKGIAYPTLTGVSSPSIVLSESRQKAVIEVDEDGTTAATVTHHKGDWNLLPAPGEIIVFNADHPFVFLIREKSSDTILFMGTLTE